MKKIYFLSILLITVFGLQAQSVSNNLNSLKSTATLTGEKPLSDADVQDNFENDGSATSTWMFEDVNYDTLQIVTDPVDSKNHVANYKRSGTYQWTNAQTILDHRLDLSKRNVFKLRVYFPSSNDYTGKLTPTVSVKLQSDSLGANAWTTQTAIEKTVTQFDQWQTFEFDFSFVSDTTDYDKIVVQLGGEGHNVAGQFYFDDFYLEPATSQGKPLLATNVQDNFENDGTATITDWKFQDPNLVPLQIVKGPVGTTNHVANYDRSGAFLYTNAQAILDHRLDLSKRNVFKLRVYFPSTNNYTGLLTPTVSLKLQNSLLGANAWSTQTEIKDTVTKFDQWVTFDFNFSGVADSVNYDQIVVQLGGENHNVPGQFYFDDFYLEQQATGIANTFAPIMRIFPNPVVSHLQISGIKNIKQIDIYSLTGRKVFSSRQTGHTLDVSSLPTGIYLINVKNQTGKTFSTKLLKK